MSQNATRDGLDITAGERMQQKTQIVFTQHLAIYCLLLSVAVTGCSDHKAQVSEQKKSGQVANAIEQTSALANVTEEQQAEVPLDVPMVPDESIVRELKGVGLKEAASIDRTGQVSSPNPTSVESVAVASTSSEQAKTVVIAKPPAPLMPVEVDSPPVAVVTDQKLDSKPKLDSQPKPAESVDEQLARMRAKLLGLPEPTGEPETPREIKLLIPENNFDIDPKHKALRITFDDIDLLKVLNMEPVPKDADQHMPKWLSDLNGQRIILRGWMYPAGRSDGIERFMFVRDSGLCCFGSNPKIYDKLAVTMRDGVTTKYIQGRAFDVVATLRIEADILDDELFFLYHLDDSIVIDE